MRMVRYYQEVQPREVGKRAHGRFLLLDATLWGVLQMVILTSMPLATLPAYAST